VDGGGVADAHNKSSDHRLRPAVCVCATAPHSIHLTAGHLSGEPEKDEDQLSRVSSTLCIHSLRRSNRGPLCAVRLRLAVRVGLLTHPPGRTYDIIKIDVTFFTYIHDVQVSVDQKGGQVPGKIKTSAA
jgi:hypothetical protein